MKGTTSFLFFLLMTTSLVYAQSVRKRTSYFSVNGGPAFVHYINSLKLGANAASVNHVGFSAKVMWEPEHRLALGLESGYYPFYKVEGSARRGYASMAVVPIMINIRMRVVKNFYVSTGTGFAMMLSTVEALQNTAESSQLSLSNFQLSGLYLKPITKQVSFGGEFKYLSVDKTNDDALLLAALVSFRF